MTAKAIAVVTGGAGFIGSHKYLGEVAVFHWGRVYRLPVNAIRIFNAYGTRARTSGTYGAVFGVFLRQKLEGKPFTVVEDGSQSRGSQRRRSGRARGPLRGVGVRLLIHCSAAPRRLSKRPTVRFVPVRVVAMRPTWGDSSPR